MKFRIVSILILVFVFGAAAFLIDEPLKSVPEQLQKISVTVKAGTEWGSGTLVTRMIGDDTVTFVWIGGHVIDKLRSVRKVIDANGVVKILVEFNDVQIVQEYYQDGRRVGEQMLDCKVIKYSDADYGEDLAVLMVRFKNAYSISTTAKFPEANYVPPIGANLSHCGSLHGQKGANSYTTGVLSQTGRLLKKLGVHSRVFDQVTTIAFPGSSGGGVYLKNDGTYIGMLTKSYRRQGFSYIVPYRRMHRWAKTSGIAWAIDPKVPMPSFAEIETISVEEFGIL